MNEIARTIPNHRNVAATATAGAGLTARSLRQHRDENGGVAALEIARRGDQGDATSAGRIPQLLERYSLGRTAFSWKEKRQILEPQLLPLAERLKIALCKRITELREAGKPDSDAEAIAAGEYEVSVEDKSYWLESPALRRADLAKVMTAFLDPEPPPESGDEYVQRGSIFSPIRHALFQARLEANEIDGVLLAGSSSLIPLVHDALDEHFEIDGPGHRRDVAGVCSPPWPGVSRA